MINEKSPGSISNVFYEFKRHFDALFLLTSDKKGLKEDIKDPVKKWIESKHISLSDSDMNMGIELFEKYKAELFRMEVL